MLDDVLPKINTSFTAKELLGYGSKLASYQIVDSQGFPFEKVTGKISKQSVVVPDTLQSNVVELHGFLFNDNEYSTTTTVQSISDEIQQDRVNSGL